MPESVRCSRCEEPFVASRAYTTLDRPICRRCALATVPVAASEESDLPDPFATAEAEAKATGKTVDEVLAERREVPFVVRDRVRAVPVADTLLGLELDALKTIIDFCREKTVGYGGWYEEDAVALEAVEGLYRRLAAKEGR